jgi:hypothetical protein
LGGDDVIAVAAPAAEQGQRSVTDRTGWPVVEVAVSDAETLDLAVGELEEIVAAEQPFALLVSGPATLAAWERLLWGAPHARRRLRRLRPALGTWCRGTAHVVADDAEAPAALRLAGLSWGCAAQAFTDAPAARSWLRGSLGH